MKGLIEIGKMDEKKGETGGGGQGEEKKLKGKERAAAVARVLST